MVAVPELKEWRESQAPEDLPTSDREAGPRLEGLDAPPRDQGHQSWWLWVCLAVIITVGLLIVGRSLVTPEQVGRNGHATSSSLLKSAHLEQGHPQGIPRGKGIEEYLGEILSRWKCDPGKVASAVNHARNFDTPRGRSLSVEKDELLKMIRSDDKLVDQLKRLRSDHPDYLVFLEHDLNRLGRRQERGSEAINACLEENLPEWPGASPQASQVTLRSV